MRVRRAAGLLLLSALLAGARTAIAVSVAVSTELAGGRSGAGPVDTVVRFTAQPAGGASGTGEKKSVEIALAAPGRATVDLDAAVASWRVQGAARGFFSPERVLLRPAAGQDSGGPPLVLVFYPTAHLVARVAAPADGRPPAELVAHFQAAPGHHHEAAAVPEDSVRCAVRTLSWECDVPAGAVDLRLKGEGLIPLYFWGLDLAAGGRKDLGALQLHRGAAVAGWLVTEAGLPAAAGTRVELVVQSASPPWQQTNPGRLGALASETHSNERGFFQLAGIRPGAYVLTASGPGYAPVRRAPIVVHEGLQSEILEPLVLGPPLRLVVLLDPPLDPYGQPWALQLAEKDAPAARAHAGHASAEGRWEQGGLAPGTYRLVVPGSDAAAGTRWVDQEVRLARDSGPVEIRIPLVEIAGSVTLGSDPLAATVWFGGRSAATRVRFDSDVKGRFQGFLPRSGSWLVDVDADAPRLKASLPPCQVTVREGQQRARVDLRVPNTVVSGQVVDQEGNRIADATVSAYQGSSSEVTSDANGEFEFRGLSPGMIPFEAQKDDVTSGTTPVDVAEQGNPSLRLVLKRMIDVRGQVVAATGSVAGAEIVAVPGMDVGEGAASGTVLQLATDADGTFTLHVPATTVAIELLVFPPGYAMRMLPVTLSGTASPAPEPLEIQVAANGGTLVIDQGAAAGGGAGAAAPFIAHAGSWTILPLLLRWAQLQQSAAGGGPGQVRLPNVEPGVYDLCVNAAVELRQRQGSPSDGRCVGGVVAPGSELVLRVPAAAR